MVNQSVNQVRGKAITREIWCLHYVLFACTLPVPASRISLNTPHMSLTPYAPFIRYNVLAAHTLTVFCEGSIPKIALWGRCWLSRQVAFFTTLPLIISNAASAVSLVLYYLKPVSHISTWVSWWIHMFTPISRVSGLSCFPWRTLALSRQWGPCTSSLGLISRKYYRQVKVQVILFRCWTAISSSFRWEYSFCFTRNVP